MSEQNNVNDLLDALAKVLLRCFVLGVLLLLISFGVFLVADDWAHGFHAKWFDVSKHEFDLMYYYGMIYVKICVILFFLIPYIAIRMVLRKRKT